jgi:hypothetical protein
MILDFYSVNCFVRRIIGRIGKVGREVATFLTIKLKLA